SDAGMVRRDPATKLRRQWIDHGMNMNLCGVDIRRDHVSGRFLAHLVQVNNNVRIPNTMYLVQDHTSLLQMALVPVAIIIMTGGSVIKRRRVGSFRFGT